MFNINNYYFKNTITTSTEDIITLIKAKLKPNYFYNIKFKITNNHEKFNKFYGKLTLYNYNDSINLPNIIFDDMQTVDDPEYNIKENIIGYNDNYNVYIQIKGLIDVNWEIVCFVECNELNNFYNL
jgi:hypothetical protein